MSVLTLVGVAFVLGVAVVLIVLVVCVVGRSSGATDDQPPSSVGVMAFQRARYRALLCVGLALAMLVAGAAFDAAVPELLGLPLALAPGLAAAGALCGYAALPVAVDPTRGRISASLTPRTAWSYGSRRAFAVPGTITVGTLGFLTWAALAADPDDRGRMRVIRFTDGSLTSSSGPFPGSFYGVPLALATVLLAAAAYSALRRISGTPTLPDPTDATADRRWRTASTRLVTLVASAALLGYLGGVAFYAGLTVRSAGSTLVLNGGRAAGVVPAGTSLALAGAALCLAGVVAAVLAVGQALTLRPASTVDPATHLVRPARR